MAETIAALLFGAGYLAITLEHRLFLNKAALSLVLAAVLWLVVGLALPITNIQHALTEAGSDIFGLVIFLLTAMTLVEVLIHYHFFDVIESTLRRRGWTLYRLGWALAGITFVFSAFLDNLTTTIVGIQIARRLFPAHHLPVIGALVIISANAGGAFSPIGDVTTLMLWFAQKFTAGEVITQGFLPSAALAAVAGLLLLRHIPRTTCPEAATNGHHHPSRSDRAIMVATIGAFLLPLAATLVGLPPYLGLIAGLGLVWLLIDVAKQARPQETHLEARIKKFFQQTDLESIQFFVGILLAVAALHALGLLDLATNQLLGATPGFARQVATFAGLGVGSAIVDNVPLTAAAISALDGISSTLWVLLALTVGTGGSLLVIGSAAGVIAQGMVPELTFGRYLKIGTLPAAAGFAAALVVWLTQFLLIR